MTKLLLLVTYMAKPGMREQFIDEVTASGVLEDIRAEKGCICYDYYRSVKDENMILIVEKWESAEEQAIHLEQPHMGIFKDLKGRCIESTTLERFEL